MPDKREIDRAIEAVYRESDLQRVGLAQRRALKLLDMGVWEGSVTPFFQARAEQRINSYIRTVWDRATRERVANPLE
ncbi:MAG TPA: hypothetical protein VM778_12390 [Gemmatimonadota bacterium]|nr:hypothetical protein [Gemmatimonadota bacterium]